MSKASTIPPESPRFIQAPQPPQPSYAPRKEVKGFLPVPREVFPPRSHGKPGPKYLAAATRRPQKSFKADSTAGPAGPIDATRAKQLERTKWKRRMAKVRRRNLRQGLVELHQRKMATVKATKDRRKQERAEREEAQNRPQREDERLTSPSITQAMQQLRVGILPDPGREARIARMKANVEETLATQRAKRMRALHTLYINARHFITTEAHLQDSIDKVFIEKPAHFVAERGTSNSIWGSGLPPSVQDMLNVDGPDPARKDLPPPDYRSITRRRLHRIGEELTGGEIVED